MRLILPARVLDHFSMQQRLNIGRSCRFADSLLIVSSCVSQDRKHVPLITFGSAKQRYFMRRLLILRIASHGWGWLFDANYPARRSKSGRPGSNFLSPLSSSSFSLLWSDPLLRFRGSNFASILFSCGYFRCRVYKTSRYARKLTNSKRACS